MSAVAVSVTAKPAEFLVLLGRPARVRARRCG